MNLESTPQVSVIIPMFNAGDTVVAAVQSALGQTLTSVEVIVVDDGSSDDGPARLAAIDDPRLRVIRAKHGGVSRARNRGIDVARGRFITFLDSDDMWTPDKLQAQVDALEADPGAWAVYSWTVFCDSNGRYLSAKAPEYASGDVYGELLATFFLASGSNALARRQCIEAIGGFDPGAEPVEDWDFWLRCSKMGRFALVPRYQILYRFSTGSASSAGERYFRSIERIAEREFSRGPAELQRRRAECLSTAKQHVCMLYMMRTLAPDAHSRSGRALLDSIATRPSALLSGRTLSLVCTWLTLLLLPRARRIGGAYAILRRYGRWMLRNTPELRAIAAASSMGVGH